MEEQLKFCYLVWVVNNWGMTRLEFRSLALKMRDLSCEVVSCGKSRDVINRAAI